MNVRRGGSFLGGEEDFYNIKKYGLIMCITLTNLVARLILFFLGKIICQLIKIEGFKPCIFKHVDLVAILSRKMPPESHVK